MPTRAVTFGLNFKIFTTQDKFFFPLFIEMLLITSNYIADIESSSILIIYRFFVAQDHFTKRKKTAINLEYLG